MGIGQVVGRIIHQLYLHCYFLQHNAQPSEVYFKIFIVVSHANKLMIFRILNTVFFFNKSQNNRNQLKSNHQIKH